MKTIAGEVSNSKQNNKNTKLAGKKRAKRKQRQYSQQCGNGIQELI